MQGVYFHELQTGKTTWTDPRVRSGLCAVLPCSWRASSWCALGSAACTWGTSALVKAEPSSDKGGQERDTHSLRM
jgi:hypothetical protein